MADQKYTITGPLTAKYLDVCVDKGCEEHKERCCGFLSIGGPMEKGINGGDGKSSYGGKARRDLLWDKYRNSRYIYNPIIQSTQGVRER